MNDEAMARFQSRWTSGFFRGPDGRVRWPTANRCLEVTVTGHALRIQMMPPFSLMFGPRQLGYKLNIPLTTVTRTQRTRFLGWWHTARVWFTTEGGQDVCLELGFTGLLPQYGPNQLKQRDRFVQVLRAVAAHAGPAPAED